MAVAAATELHTVANTIIKFMPPALSRLYCELAQRRRNAALRYGAIQRRDHNVSRAGKPEFAYNAACVKWIVFQNGVV